MPYVARTVNVNSDMCPDEVEHVIETALAARAVRGVTIYPPGEFRPKHPETFYPRWGFDVRATETTNPVITCSRCRAPYRHGMPTHEPGCPNIPGKGQMPPPPTADATQLPITFDSFASALNYNELHPQTLWVVPPGVSDSLLHGGVLRYQLCDVEGNCLGRGRGFATVAAAIEAYNADKFQPVHDIGVSVNFGKNLHVATLLTKAPDPSLLLDKNTVSFRRLFAAVLAFRDKYATVDNDTE